MTDIIELIDTYAETRHRCGGIYNAKTEAARKAVIEALSGVQALSAAPNGWESVIDAARSGLQDSEPSAFDNSGYRAFAETVLDAVEEGLSALAASPTPPAEQTAITPETGNPASANGAAITSESGAVYAELCCDEVSRAVDVVVERCISLTQDATGIKVVYDPIILANALRTELRDFADRTHALRMEQAAPKAAQYEMNKEASNVRLDIDSNSTKPEQQRDVACSLEVGQHVGNGEHQGASCRGSEDSELLKIAARNLKYFIEHAQFSSFADKRAALNCLDALGAPPAEQAAPKAAPGESADSLAVPDNCPHILWFDDQDLKPVVFAGNGAKRAALEAYRQASMQWNAHLFVRIAVNSRDCQYPCAAPQQEAQEPSRDAKTWCSYVAGMIGCYLKKPDESAEVRAIAGIIERRLWALPAPQPAPAPMSEDVVKDAARWRWLSEHIGVAWNEGKFTSLVRIVSDKNRTALNASIDRMMTGDWSDAAIAAQGGTP